MELHGLMNWLLIIPSYLSALGMVGMAVALFKVATTCREVATALRNK